MNSATISNIIPVDKGRIEHMMSAIDNVKNLQKVSL